jgi:hypothetical protein
VAFFSALRVESVKPGPNDAVITRPADRVTGINGSPQPALGTHTLNVGKTGPRAGGKRMYCGQGGVQTRERFTRVTTGIYTTRRGGDVCM